VLCICVQMESSAIYGLESQGRALCSHTNEAETIRFFLGTLSTRSEGQIHQLDFEEETNQITRRVYKPRIGEIWQIQCCPTTPDLLGICHNEITDKSSQMKSSLWRLPDKNKSTQNSQDALQPECELNLEKLQLDKENVLYLDWHPSRKGVIATVLERNLVIWDVANGAAQVKTNFEIPNKVYSGKWNPHLDGNQFALISGPSLSGTDIRSMKTVWNFPKAHNFQIRDVDFNPNKQYYLATCGDDCITRFWDFRKPNEALKVLDCHSHWVWRVRFNNFHDQLVLTASSDSRVLLHSLPSISSEPKGHAVFSDSEEDVERNSTPLEEGILAKYEEHEDAVYAVEWSAYDPWIFASLSYDGRLVINRVPKSQKYKIIL